MIRRWLAELRRRRVFRVAAVYAVVAWVVIEAASVILPALRLPDWSVTLVVVLAILGLPIALVLAWAFQLTPEGLAREGAGSGPTTSASATPAGPTSASPTSSPAGRIAAVGGALVLAGAGTAFLLLRPADLELVDNRVVVTAFENRTGDPELDAVGPMAADWLVRVLQQAGSFETVPLSATLALSGGAHDIVRTPESLARATGARVVVTGAYYAEGDSLRVVAEVHDAGRGELLYTSEPVAAPRDRPSDGLEALQRAVAGFLAIWGDEGYAGTLAQVLSPPDFEVYREYAAGFEMFNRQEYRRAQPYFARAVALDSTFVLAIVLGFFAHSNLGEWAEAARYVHRLERIRNTITPYERQWADQLTARLNGDLRATFRAARRAAELAPNEADHYLTSVYALWLNRGAQAVEAIERIRLDGWMARSDWWPYWNRRASAHHMVEAYDRELEIVRDGLRRHPGEAALLAREAAALAGLGRPDDVLARVDDALGRLSDPATIATTASLELRAHGYEAEAREAAQRLVAWHAARSGDPDAGVDRPDRFHALYLARRWEDALPLARTWAEGAPDSPAALGAHGRVAARVGDRATAEAVDQRLASLDRPYLFGQDHHERAAIAALLGDRQRAVDLMRRTFEAGRGLQGLHTDMDFEALAGWPPFEALRGPQ